MDFIFEPSLVFSADLAKHDGTSFMSDDDYGHLCTVTGALWRPGGRYFDGVSDEIDCGSSSVLKFTTQAFTLNAWIYPTDFSTTPILIDNTGFASGYVAFINAGGAAGQLSFRTYQAGTKQTTSSKVGRFATDIWQMVTITRDGAVAKIYRDGIEEDEYAAQGTHVDPLAGSQNFTIGLLAGGNTNDFTGTIGEVQVYSRVLTPLEIHQNYLVTKWRYQ